MNADVLLADVVQQRDLNEVEARALVSSEPQWVYLMRAGATMKIGYSADPIRRMREVFSDLAAPTAVPATGDQWVDALIARNVAGARHRGQSRSALTLVAVVPGDRVLERRLLAVARRAGAADRGEYCTSAGMPMVLAAAPWTHVGLPYRAIVPATACR